MDWVTDSLAIGAGTDVSECASAGVTWLVNVAQEVTYDTPWNLGGVKCGGVISGRPIRPVVEVVAALIRAKQKVLLHCAGGANRSPAVAVCVLMALGHTEDEARAIASKRPGYAPTEDVILRYKQEIGGAT